MLEQPSSPESNDQSLVETQLSSWSQLPREERQTIIQRIADSQNPEDIQTVLSLIRAPEGWGVYASAGPNYEFAVFGRDSLEFAEDILLVLPDLSKEIILMCACLQGRHDNSSTEEVAGKVHHEFRSRHFDHQVISHAAEVVLAELSSKWGGEGDELCYYGTVDATPLFIRLLDRYVEEYGDEILQTVIKDRHGHELSLHAHVRMASEWLIHQIDNSQWKLLEYKRLNPMGLPNQAWKDSETSYLHLDGSSANADGGIAAVEVQGYAYDALLASARISAFDDGEAEDWRSLATQLQKNTLEKLWMPESGFFAQGLDRDGQGNPRQIATLTSNAAALLDSQLLMDLPDSQRQNYLAFIVRTITGPDFLTDAGVRLRALRHVDLINFADYHGAQVSWPKETYDIAKGLRRHGRTNEATDLERRIAQAVLRSGEFYEFYFVNRDGKVKYNYRLEHPDEPEFHTFGAANTPEPGQAWSLSAFLGISLR